MRWSEDEYAQFLARQGAAPAPSTPRSQNVTPAKRRSSGGSPLERELRGNLTVMQLAPETQYKFHPERRWRFDFAFPDVMVAVELDGGIFAAENATEAGRHARGAGRCADMEKRNAAAELGWIVLCYGPPHVRSGEAALQVERIVRTRRGLGLLTRELDGRSVNERLE